MIDNLKYSFGIFCEKAATQYLKSQNYSILENNFRYKKSEIDIIAKYKNILIFVEVKGRRNENYGYPEDFVTEAKEKLIILGANQFIEKIKWEEDIRFDIISIIGNKNNFTIEHFKDVFY